MNPKRIVHIGGMPWKRMNPSVPSRDYFRELPSGAVVRVQWSTYHVAPGRKDGRCWFAHYYSRFADFQNNNDCFVASATRGAHAAVKALRRGMIGRVNEI